MLQLLWALPALGALYLWGFSQNRQAMERFATLNLLGMLVPAVLGLIPSFRARMFHSGLETAAHRRLLHLLFCEWRRTLSADRIVIWPDYLLPVFLLEESRKPIRIISLAGEN